MEVHVNVDNDSILISSRITAVSAAAPRLVFQIDCLQRKHGLVQSKNNIAPMARVPSSSFDYAGVLPL